MIVVVVANSAWRAETLSELPITTFPRFVLCDDRAMRGSCSVWLTTGHAKIFPACYARDYLRISRITVSLMQYRSVSADVDLACRVEKLLAKGLLDPRSENAYGEQHTDDHEGNRRHPLRQLRVEQLARAIADEDRERGHRPQRQARCQ